MPELTEKEKVDVHFGGQRLPGWVSRIDPDHAGGRTIKVVFDDPLVFGGAGAGWFKPIQVSRPGQLPEEGS